MSLYVLETDPIEAVRAYISKCVLYVLETDLKGCKEHI